MWQYIDGHLGFDSRIDGIIGIGSHIDGHIDGHIDVSFYRVYSAFSNILSEIIFQNIKRNMGHRVRVVMVVDFK